MKKIQTTVHFEQLENSDKRITIHQGGTRSGKTYNILIWFILMLLQQENKVFTVARKTLPSLKTSAFRDFIEILDERLGMFDPSCLNKTELTYKLGSNLVEFISLDSPQKVRGRKRNYLFINEANEITREDWLQLSLRTTDKVVLDYNPSDEFHFIYDDIKTRDDCDFYRTTYLDNINNLPIATVREIERLKADPNLWAIYGRGEIGMSGTTIFRNWEMIDDYDAIESREEIYGLDFGYNDPTAMVKVKILDREIPEIYIKQCLCKTHMTSHEITDSCKEILGGAYSKIYGDCARPEIIEDMRRAGLNIYPSVKGKNSVKDSIDFLKKHKLFIDKSSYDLIKEMRMYKWKVHSDERVLEEPVDLNNHLIDALRYAAYKKVIPFGVAIIG